MRATPVWSFLGGYSFRGGAFLFSGYGVEFYDVGGGVFLI